MPFSSHIGDREKDKFVETTEGETAVRTSADIIDPDAVSKAIEQKHILNLLSNIDTNLNEIKEIIRLISSMR